MKFAKKILGIIMSLILMLQMPLMFTVYAIDTASGDVDPLKYTYEIIPLLEPFNEYFFVKTDNPHPESFRFSDKDSPYSETSVIYNDSNIYEDVKYENKDMWRVKGGYIFKSYTTNGGLVTLQVQEEITEEEFNTVIFGTPAPDYTAYTTYHGMPVGTYTFEFGDGSHFINGYYKWVDTDVKINLPPLCDECDYLIENYATESDFFSNMDAIQEALESKCLYSGSYIRGQLYREDDGCWELSHAAHFDQVFYIYSPYNRKDNKYLFASSLYPFIHDSLGFPAVMALISERLNADSSYEKSHVSHAYIDVTYNGETKRYGGSGNGKGQGLSEDKIAHIFSFGDNNELLTLEESKALLDGYIAVEMEDDIPRNNAFTWEDIYNTVGDGAWVKMSNNNYTYLFQEDDDATFNAEEWGVGYSLYWGGSLGYCSDMWVDGRYINKFEYFSVGETFDEHPESNILLTEATIPKIVNYEREWNSETDSYDTFVEIVEEERKNILYYYNSERKCWIIDSFSWDWEEESFYNSFDTFETLAEQGIIDQKYYDMVMLTQEEVEALILEFDNARNLPESGYKFDGTDVPGMPFVTVIGDANDDNEVNVRDCAFIATALAKGQADTLTDIADYNKDGKINVRDAAAIASALAKGEL